MWATTGAGNANLHVAILHVWHITMSPAFVWPSAKKNGMYRMQSDHAHLYLLSLYNYPITPVLTFYHMKLNQVPALEIWSKSFLNFDQKPGLCLYSHTSGYYWLDEYIKITRVHSPE